MTASTLDQAKAEAFAGQMLGVLNGGMLGLMVSIGHQTGLFDTMADLPPASSPQIAKAAALHERYVREWLGAMVTGQIVTYDPDTDTYMLPPEHSAALTRAAGTDNLAKFAQYIALFGNVEEQVIECFRNGGGVPYSAYPRFQQLQAEETSATYDATLIETTLPLIPGLIERLRAGIDVVDLGCGRGHAINLMARAFPQSRFTGYDFSVEGTAAGREEAATWGLTNARFETKDVTTLDTVGAYDFILSCDVIHDLATPDQTLTAIAHALRSGGVFLMIDLAASSHLAENIEHPLAPALYTVSCMHCMTVSLSQDGAGLGAMWGEQKAREMLAAARFAHVEVKQIPGDFLNNYYIATMH